MSDHSSQSPLEPDKHLPPVTPPSPAFLIQLFVIPAMIIGIIVSVYLVFTWLANWGGDPASQLQSLRSGGEARYYFAHNLAQMLGTDQKGVYRGDSKLCHEVAVTLEQFLLDDTATKPHVKEDNVKVKVYLCTALGAFSVDDGADALMKAATTNKRDIDLPVRVAALQSLGALAGQFHDKKPPQPWRYDDKVVKLLLDASAEDNILRERAAFLLGEFNTTESQAKLLELLGDPKITVRFNAATSLAKQNKTESLPVLIEMLRITGADYEKLAASEKSKQDGQTVTVKDLKDDDRRAAAENRKLTINTALKSIKSLRSAVPDLKIDDVNLALESLKQDKDSEIARLTGDALANLKSPAEKK
jgi:hypothetical protein